MDINLTINDLEKFAETIQPKIIADGKKEYRHFEIGKYQIIRVLNALAEYSRELDKTSPDNNKLEGN